MAQTPSNMLPLGTIAPDFKLRDTNATDFKTFADCKGEKGTVVMFICNHCPFVKHLADALAVFGREYQTQGVAVVAINANDASKYPDDSPERMVHEAEDRGYSFPYLYDETQEVAQAYHAACTPDFFVFDKDQRLVYRGQFDDSRPQSDIPISGKDLRAAVDAVLSGQKPPEPQRPSIGCNIKWREGSEPEYFNPRGVA